MERRASLPGPAIAFSGLSLSLVAVLLAFGASSAFASGSSESKCDPPFPFQPPRFSDKVHSTNDEWKGSHAVMPRSEARVILKAVWKKLYKRCHDRELTRRQLRHRLEGNLRQIDSDSGFVPAARSPTGQHAKGLLQMIDPVFENWHVPKHDDVYHPLDNLIAAVNIQLNADKVVSVVDEGYVYPNNVLNGRHGGWGLHGGDNPYRPFH